MGDQHKNGCGSHRPREMEQYMAARKALIDQEKSMRHDHSFRQSLSATAQEAARIVRNIRRYEMATRWRHEGRTDVFAGMAFSRARESIHESVLWKIVQRVPKGSLLHAHFDAMVEMPWLVDEALKHPGLSIASDRPLVDSASLTLASLDLLYIQHLPSLGPGKKSLLFSPNYQPGTRVSLRQAVQDFPGGEAAFKDWFLSRVTITDDETYSYHLGIDHIWGKFESVFPILNGLVFFEPIFRRMVRRMFANLLADGIRYIDLRIAFVFQWTTSSGEKGSFEDLIRVFEEEAEALQTTPAGEELWGGRIIWTIHRSQHAAGVEESMRDCMALKKKYPRVISGFDLVGQEGLGYTLLHHLPLLFWFREECARQNLDIPFFFHAGEVLGDGDEHDMNVVDAVLLDTKRIGHGYSLYKHPEIMKQVRERDICVEVCPISNETLRLNSSILGHPLPAMLAHGIPVVLANDDPGILGHGVTGSSHDFWQVLQAFDNVGLEGLGDMAETSVWFSAFHDGTGGEEPIGYGKGLAGGIRQRRVAEWRRQWEQFCSWVVAEYGRWSEWEEPDGALQQ